MLWHPSNEHLTAKLVHSTAVIITGTNRVLAQCSCVNVCRGFQLAIHYCKKKRKTNSVYTDILFIVLFRWKLEMKSYAAL